MDCDKIALMPVLRGNPVTRFAPRLSFISQPGNQLVVLVVERNPPVKLPYRQKIPMDIRSAWSSQLVINCPDKAVSYTHLTLPTIYSV